MRRNRTPRRPARRRWVGCYSSPRSSSHSRCIHAATTLALALLGLRLRRSSASSTTGSAIRRGRNRGLRARVRSSWRTGLVGAAFLGSRRRERRGAAAGRHLHVTGDDPPRCSVVLVRARNDCDSGDDARRQSDRRSRRFGGRNDVPPLASLRGSAGASGASASPRPTLRSPARCSAFLRTTAIRRNFSWATPGRWRSAASLPGARS